MQLAYSETVRLTMSSFLRRIRKCSCLVLSSVHQPCVSFRFVVVVVAAVVVVADAIVALGVSRKGR